MLNRVAKKLNTKQTSPQQILISNQNIQNVKPKIINVNIRFIIFEVKVFVYQVQKYKDSSIGHKHILSNLSKNKSSPLYDRNELIIVKLENLSAIKACIMLSYNWGVGLLGMTEYLIVIGRMRRVIIKLTQICPYHTAIDVSSSTFQGNKSKCINQFL